MLLPKSPKEIAARLSAFWKLRKAIFTRVPMAIGLLLTIGCCVYLNTSYTVSAEDALMSRMVYLKNKWLKIKPEKQRDILFINTGKDLSLVDDTADFGQVVISDRYKIYTLLRAIQRAADKPAFVLLDLQFYYHNQLSIDDNIQHKVTQSGLQSFYADPAIDDSLRQVIADIKNLAITVVTKDNQIQYPLFKAAYGLADYRTFGTEITKFQLHYPEYSTLSIPALLNERLDHENNEKRWPLHWSFCRFLRFNYVYPSYYAIDKNLDDPHYQFYSIGSLVQLKDDNLIGSMVKDKLVVIGNFEGDQHRSPNGSMAGSIILSDIYLGLLNDKQYTSVLWLFFVFVFFTTMGYYTLRPQTQYEPCLKLSGNRFCRFSKYVINDIFYRLKKKIVARTFLLALFSSVSIVLFNQPVYIFAPLLLLSLIDYFVNKRYRHPYPETACPKQKTDENRNVSQKTAL